YHVGPQRGNAPAEGGIGPAPRCRPLADPDGLGGSPKGLPGRQGQRQGFVSVSSATVRHGRPLPVRAASTAALRPLGHSCRPPPPLYPTALARGARRPSSTGPFPARFLTRLRAGATSGARSPRSPRPLPRRRRASAPSAEPQSGPLACGSAFVRG